MRNSVVIRLSRWCIHICVSNSKIFSWLCRTVNLNERTHTLKPHQYIVYFCLPQEKCEYHETIDEGNYEKYFPWLLRFSVFDVDNTVFLVLNQCKFKATHIYSECVYKSVNNWHEGNMVKGWERGQKVDIFQPSTVEYCLHLVNLFCVWVFVRVCMCWPLIEYEKFFGVIWYFEVIYLSANLIVKIHGI